MIFRLDDISGNTNFTKLSRLLHTILSRYNCEIWLAASILSKKNSKGSVYPDPPFKDKENDYFWDVDQFFTNLDLHENLMPYVKVVSHGLLHCDHTRVDRDAQEMSIVTSCNILGADIFVPPFNRWNYATSEICDEHDIELVRYEDGWLSLEHNDFYPSHERWYLHPWMWTNKKLKDKLDASKKLGQFHSDTLPSS